MSSTQVRKDYEFDLARLIPKSIVFMTMVFIVGVLLGYILSPKPIDNQDETIVMFMDDMIAQERFCLGSVCITDDMTWQEIRGQYQKFRNQPPAQGLIVSAYKQMCGGI